MNRPRPWKRVVWAVGGLALGLAVALGLRHVLSPWRSLPAERPWVVVSPNCPYSKDIFHQIREASDDSPLREIVVVPADANPVAMAASLGMCSTTLEQIEWNETWFSWAIPEALACRWLVEDAARFHVEHGGYWPAWVAHGRVVRADRDIDSMLEGLGLTLDSPTNTLLPIGQAVPESRRPRPAAPTTSDSVWDDLSEPHIVGW